jgi:hypothetical protein
MLDRFVGRTAARLARREVAQVAVWTAVNIVLAVLFSALLHFDDRVARAVGF